MNVEHRTLNVERRMSVASPQAQMNVEHRTLNVERRMSVV
jgi:hypothetical protein